MMMMMKYKNPFEVKTTNPMGPTSNCLKAFRITSANDPFRSFCG